jgi:hypothetical protein
LSPHANRHRCGKSVTLPDNLTAGQKESQSRRNHSKKLDVSWSGIRAGGGHCRKTTPEYWIDGRPMRAALKARHRAKGYAIELIGESS